MGNFDNLNYGSISFDMCVLGFALTELQIFQTAMTSEQHAESPYMTAILHDV